MSIERQTIIHDGPGARFESMAVYDPSAGNQPGMLLFPTFMGTSEPDFVQAERLAGLGFKVLVVDFYGQGRRASRMEDAALLMKELVSDRAMMRDRLLASLAELRNLPDVDPERLGAVGFCLGGMCVLDLVRAGAELKCGVVFHGSYEPPPFLNQKMVAKLLICHGWNDPICPPGATVALANELTAAGVDWQLHVYGNTGHAFTSRALPLDEQKQFGFQPDADRRSWQATQDFFKEALA